VAQPTVRGVAEGKLGFVVVDGAGALEKLSVHQRLKKGKKKKE
jgi:hypothetical protein